MALQGSKCPVGSLLVEQGLRTQVFGLGVWLFCTKEGSQSDQLSIRRAKNLGSPLKSATSTGQDHSHDDNDDDDDDGNGNPYQPR
jgi:hypothetical protein